MPNTLARIRRGIGVGLQAMQNAPDMSVVEKQLDALVAGDTIEPVVEKAGGRRRKRKSKLDIRDTIDDLQFVNYFHLLRAFGAKKDEIPCYGDHSRDFYLSNVWRQEPILAGAVYSMSAKMTALGWQVTGRRNLALYHAKIFARAAYMGGEDWGGFQAVTTQDFYTTDKGVVWETPRVGSSLVGMLADIGHIDSLQCTLTGNTRRPIHYLSDVTGQQIRYRPGEFIHFSSMTSPREKYLGIGFCATSRALRAAKMLSGLHDYDEEKLSNLPPEGVAAISGLTMQEFQDALTLWRAARKKDDSLTFPQVLWLIGSQPNSEVKVSLQGFSQIPESFERKDVVDQYVNTLALCFGVDAREFWPVSTSTLGTAAESEIQHMKAKGKGPGEYISITERHLNGELPEGVEFAYDTQDIEEDMAAAGVAKGWVDAFFPLTIAGGAAEGLLSKDEFFRLLADREVIPDWLVKDERISIQDSDVHQQKEWSHDDSVCIVWKDGILYQKRLPVYEMNHAYFMDTDLIPLADVLEEKEVDDSERNIRGQPVPDEEALRGARITRSAVEQELELWRTHPLLQEYAPTVEEASEIAFPKK